jgi:hypothetical protein
MKVASEENVQRQKFWISDAELNESSLSFIIIGKTTLFEPQPSLEHSARFTLRPSGFHLFEFCKKNYLIARPAPNLEDQVSVFMSSSDRVAPLYPQTPGSLFIALYDSHVCGGGIVTRLHTGQLSLVRLILHDISK